MPPLDEDFPAFSPAWFDAVRVAVGRELPDGWYLSEVSVTRHHEVASGDSSHLYLVALSGDRRLCATGSSMALSDRTPAIAEAASQLLTHIARHP